MTTRELYPKLGCVQPCINHAQSANNVYGFCHDVDMMLNVMRLFAIHVIVCVLYPGFVSAFPHRSWAASLLFLLTHSPLSNVLHVFSCLFSLCASALRFSRRLLSVHSKNKNYLPLVQCQSNSVKSSSPEPKKLPDVCTGSSRDVKFCRRRPHCWSCTLLGVMYSWLHPQKRTFPFSLKLNKKPKN